MKKTLRLLNVEDSERDVALIHRHLTKAGYLLESVRVETLEEMETALEQQEWDIILSDHSMPQFSSINALKLVQERGLDIPFIVISGTMGEDFAVEMMRVGANDYMMKDSLTRLVPAIERELQEAENRRARRQAEIALRESEENYRFLFESNPMPTWVYDLETLSFLAVNEMAIEHYGYSREEFLSMTIKDIRPKEELPRLFENLSMYNERIERTGSWKHRKKDGSLIDVEITSHRLTFAGRKARIVLANDVTERVRAEEALRQAEKKYRSIFENSIEGIFRSNVEGRFIAINPALVKMLGYESADEIIENHTITARQHYVDPDKRMELKKILEKSDLAMGFECEFYRKNQSKLWTKSNIRVIKDENGTPLYYEGSVEDITDRKSLEEQLRQSQKLEAIGQLAGGIAHDFNNLLTAITGYSFLSLQKLHEEDPLYHNISEVQKAADRATSLTRQLLAFSRKQILQPKVLNLNTVVTDIDKMLYRLIGEDIGLLSILEPDLGTIKADPGQIEQVIVNLAVNARDAMPDGGKLTIETANVYLGEDYVSHHISVKPGNYVMLAISDTGHGMDEETQLRIFEPFFTTKDLGRGTGLGLSTVYGIVTQSGGSIWVYSEIGKGTTFKVYLPRVDEEANEIGRTTADKQEMPKGIETVLLVEDDESVRELAKMVLDGNGYNVLEAESGNVALLICEGYEETIHLLLTDVVMPEMSGLELAKQLETMHPEMRVLYMSGYTDNAIIHHGILSEGTNYIQKPFLPSALAKKIREVLDAE